MQKYTGFHAWFGTVFQNSVTFYILENKLPYGVSPFTTIINAFIMNTHHISESHSISASIIYLKPYQCYSTKCMLQDHVTGSYD